MILLRDPAAAYWIEEPELRQLVECRLELLADGESREEALGYLILLQPGDSATNVSVQVGFDVLANRYTGHRFDHPRYTPSFEILEEHRTCFELLFVLSDDGYGVVVFIPKSEGIDPDLLAMCELHSVPAIEEP